MSNLFAFRLADSAPAHQEAPAGHYDANSQAWVGGAPQARQCSYKPGQISLYIYDLWLYDLFRYC